MFKSMCISNYKTYFRNIPERPQHTIFLKISTPQLRQTISARNYSATPMFRSTRVPYSADKEKSRMHFVSPEWKSEHVSWLRFHKTDLKDIHKLGWIWCVCVTVYVISFNVLSVISWGTLGVTRSSMLTFRNIVLSTWSIMPDPKMSHVAR